MPQIPDEVSEALRSHKVVQAQLVGTNGLAWVLTGKKLFLWYYHNHHDGRKAAVHSHALPYALSEEPCHVSVVQHQVKFPLMLTQSCSCQQIDLVCLGQTLFCWCCWTSANATGMYWCSLCLCREGTSQTCWKHDRMLQVQDTKGVSVVLCSHTGNFFLWPDFTNSDDVATHRIMGIVTALAADVHPGEEADGGVAASSL